MAPCHHNKNEHRYGCVQMNGAQVFFAGTDRVLDNSRSRSPTSCCSVPADYKTLPSVRHTLSLAKHFAHTYQRSTDAASINHSSKGLPFRLRRLAPVRLFPAPGLYLRQSSRKHLWSDYYGSVSKTEARELLGSQDNSGKRPVKDIAHSHL